MTNLEHVVLAVDSFSTRHQGQECAPNAPHALDVWFDRVHVGTVAPIVATDPTARADAIDRVTRFLVADLQ